MTRYDYKKSIKCVCFIEACIETVMCHLFYYDIKVVMNILHDVTFFSKIKTVWHVGQLLTTNEQHLAIWGFNNSTF